MDLFPVRIGISEGVSQAPELFFIRASTYTSTYFISNIAPFFKILAEKEEAAGWGESVLSRMHLEIKMIIRRFVYEIDAFTRSFPGEKIQVSLDFRIENFLHISDRLNFSFPIGQIPEIYARDLFMSNGLPEGEAMTVFAFYVREEILRYAKEAVEKGSLPAPMPVVLPKVNILASPEKIRRASFSYNRHGRATAVKDQEKRKKKK